MTWRAEKPDRNHPPEKNFQLAVAGLGLGLGFGLW